MGLDDWQVNDAIPLRFRRFGGADFTTFFATSRSEIIHSVSKYYLWYFDSPGLPHGLP